MKQRLALPGLTFLLGCLLLCSLLLVAAGASADSTDKPNLSGSWTLNERLSENPRDKMRETMQQRGGDMGRGMSGGTGGRGGGMGGGMGGGKGGRGGGVGGADGMDPDAMRRRMEQLMRAAQSMVINHAEPTLSIRYDDGSERVIYTDGRVQEREGGIGYVETKAKWKKDGRLVVKATTEQGRRVKEIFQHSSGESRLYVTIELESDGRMPEVSFQRVYDLATEDPSQS